MHAGSQKQAPYLQHIKQTKPSLKGNLSLKSDYTKSATAIAEHISTPAAEVLLSFCSHSE